MKAKLCKTVFVLACITILSAVQSKAQFIEDALRLTGTNSIITPRVGGLNVAYHGISDDIGALLYNPAGLTISPYPEISIGMGFSRNNSQTDFLSELNTMKTNDEFVSHFGLSSPIQSNNRAYAVGIGYFNESNFGNMFHYEGFNQTSSFIGWEAQNGPRNFNDNIATFLTLADSNFRTPIKDSIYQKGTVEETGGLHNITGAIAFEVSDNVSIGVSLSGKFGTYGYNRSYFEIDTRHKYDYWDQQNFTNVDFDKLDVNEKIKQNISGITGSIGIMARITDFIRLGATVKFPTWYEINEDFSQTATADFDNGQSTDVPYKNVGSTRYNITTPFIYCAGASVNMMGLTFSAGIEYTDVSQLSFSDATDAVMNLNPVMKTQLVGQTTWGFGAEYKIPLVPVVVRASYASTTSPYMQDIANAYISYVSLGGGLYLSPNVRVDVLVRWKDYSELRTNYGTIENGSTYILTQKPMSMGLQLTYRY
ncbi:MAG: hypothetical protein WCT77_04480 [Bacteroidota bacterium]